MKDYPCPCCGYIVFDEPPGSYEICPICFWEDDALQLEFATTLDGGANNVTLEQAQINFKNKKVSKPEFKKNVRQPKEDERKDPLWRIINKSLDTFEIFGENISQRCKKVDESLYYWRETYWKKQKST